MIATTDILEQLADAGGSDINVQRVLRAIMKEFGGPERLAAEVHADFDALEPGHASRVRLITSILTMLGTYGTDEGNEGEDIESVAAELKAVLGDQSTDE